MFEILTEEQANKANFQSWKVGNLEDIFYSDLIRILGQPTYNETSGDSKVNVEWVLKYNNNYYTIYDWKTYDKDFTLNHLDIWSIGGNGTSDINELIKLIKSKM